MADVTGPISTLPGTRHSMPEGTMCDFHPDRPATARVQGETDSMGCEMHDLCADCAKADRDERRKPTVGKCSWCKADEVELRHTRDYEEGMNGPVYEVCAECIKRRDDRLKAELDSYGDDPYDDGDYCDRCYGTGDLDCHCGGDLCVCQNNGTYPCPECN